MQNANLELAALLVARALNRQSSPHALRVSADSEGIARDNQVCHPARLSIADRNRVLRSGHLRMGEKLMAAVSALIVSTISSLGYGGIVLMMGIESACIPLPSEVIMPFAGYLVSTGRFGLQGVALAGALGCLLGSYVAYCAGWFGGRPFLRKYGRWFLIAPHEIALADRFFDRWGSVTVFACRLLPVVRTFIAFPAGVARMYLTRFSIYTLAGSYLWCLALAYAGMQLGQHWSAIGPYFHRSQGVIAALLALAVLLFLYNRLRTLRRLGETLDH